MNQYEKRQVLPPAGTKFITKPELDKDTEGFLVSPNNIKTRRPNTQVTYKGWVTGAGGDLWWCAHEDESVAAYGAWELDEVEAQNER